MMSNLINNLTSRHVFISLIFGFFAGTIQYDLPFINQITSPDQFFLDLIVGILLAIVFIAIYILFIDSFYVDVMFQDSLEIFKDELSPVKKIIAILLNDLLIAFALIVSLISLYESYGVTIELNNLGDLLISFILLGFPLIAFFLFDKHRLKKEIEEKRQGYAKVNDKALKIKSNSNIDDVEEFIIKIIKSDTFNPDLYHQDYRVIHITDEETTTYNKFECEVYFQFLNDELGINHESINFDSFKISQREDFEFCTSIVFEYEYDLKLTGKSGISGKVKNHSIIMCTENGWICLCDTVEF